MNDEINDHYNDLYAETEEDRRDLEDELINAND